MVLFPTTLCLELGKETDYQVRAAISYDCIPYLT
jgi:hypothetical protein